MVEANFLASWNLSHRTDATTPRIEAHAGSDSSIDRQLTIVESEGLENREKSGSATLEDPNSI